MSKTILCPICGKETRPDYCSDECLYTDYERTRIIKILEANAHGNYRQVMLTPKLLAMISGGK